MVSPTTARNLYSMLLYCRYLYIETYLNIEKAQSESGGEGEREEWDWEEREMRKQGKRGKFLPLRTYVCAFKDWKGWGQTPRLPYPSSHSLFPCPSWEPVCSDFLSKPLRASSKLSIAVGSSFFFQHCKLLITHYNLTRGPVHGN